MSVPIDGPVYPRLTEKRQGGELCYCFTKDELVIFAQHWLKNNYGHVKKDNTDLYYTRLGLLVDFVTDIGRTDLVDEKKT